MIIFDRITRGKNPFSGQNHYCQTEVTVDVLFGEKRTFIIRDYELGDLYDTLQIKGTTQNVYSRQGRDQCESYGYY